MKKVFLMLLLVFAGMSALTAQRTITGMITDDKGEALIGATILVEGTTTGTVTDLDGKFSLQVPEGNNTLLITYTGFASQEIALGAQTSLDIVLKTDVIGLEDVIVVGYAPQRRKDITGSVSSVSGSAIADVPALGVQTALNGRTSGVQVVSNSGTPGGGIDVRVRGSTSLNASNQPLYVIDGVPVISGNPSQLAVGNGNLNSLADINPADIESIEVLKDASTAAIYGSRGANGVVLITTKKGKAGKSSVGFNAQYGFQEAWKKVDVLGADYYYDTLLNEMAMNRYGVGIAALGIPKDEGDTNWQDEIFRQGALQDYNLTFEGGDLKTKFFASLTYSDQEGIVKKSGLTRYSGRLNLDHSLSDRISVGSNMSFTKTEIQRLQNDNNIYGAVSSSILLPPDIPVMRDDGSWGSNYGLENPVAAVTDYNNNVQSNRFIGNLYAKYNFSNALSFKASLGADILSFREDEFIPSTLVQGSGSNGIGNTAEQITTRWITEYTLTYQKRFGQSSLTALAGTGFQEDRGRTSSLSATGFPPGISTLGGGAVKTNATTGFNVNGLQSFFGNFNYSYADRYILGVTFRADGSSRFAENNKFGYFPGVSAAWRISGEDFMAGSQFFNDLKLRVSYGVTGNQNIGDFSSLELFTVTHYADEPGIGYNQLGNPNLKWETTSQLNAGLDFTIAKSRLSGSIDYYIKKTNDLLFNRPIPTTSGFTTYLENIGNMENKGVELSLTSFNFNRPNFSWSTTLNLSHNVNTVTKLYNGQPIDAGFATRIAEGEAIGSFYGWVVEGIFQNQQEVEDHAFQTSGTAPGDIKFKDVNGDGTINSDDRAFIGSAQPDFQGGLTNVFQFKGFELSAFLQFSYGNQIFNNNTVFAEGMNSVFNQTARVYDRWRQEGDQTDIPRAVWGDPNNNRRVSERFVEDGSYLRLKSATVAYNFPSDVISTIGLSKLRIYVAGQNLLTWTDYSWFDPEVNTFDGSNVSLATDFLTYPQARSIVFGLNVSF